MKKQTVYYDVNKFTELLSVYYYEGNNEPLLNYISDIKPSRDLPEHEYSLYLNHATAEELETDSITYQTYCKSHKINPIKSPASMILEMNYMGI